MADAALDRARPVRLDPADADALREALAAWTVDATAELVGDRAVRALEREQVMPARLAARAAGTDRVALLTRLLTLGDQLVRSEAELALGSLGVDGAIRCGLVDATGAGGDDLVRALVDVRPYAAVDADGEAHWHLASDQTEAVTFRELADDHVLGAGGASATLASVTVRSPRARMLDIGTGCGVQALHAARHAQHVVATDISPRALAFARFNEALNVGSRRWDLREGSLLEPVVTDVEAGQLFDHVVSNPPFVISPSDAPRYEYRDGGVGGDKIVEHLISRVGGVLAPGGLAQMLGNWEIRGDWRDRLGRWLDASPVPLDAWIIQRDAEDAAEYAETWLRDGGLTDDRDPARFEDAYAAWLRDFDARGVEAVGFGIVTLRRAPEGRPPLRRLEEHAGPLQQPLGGHVADVLAAHDWLAARTDDQLFDARLTVAADVTEERYAAPGAPDPRHIIIRQGGGLGRALDADTALAGFLGACDGELTAGQIAHALAALLDVPAGTMLEGLAPVVRDLVLDGFLTPAD